jgi:hypothetical protein
MSVAGGTKPVTAPAGIGPTVGHRLLAMTRPELMATTVAPFLQRAVTRTTMAATAAGTDGTAAHSRMTATEERFASNLSVGELREA